MLNVGALRSFDIRREWVCFGERAELYCGTLTDVGNDEMYGWEVGVSFHNIGGRCAHRSCDHQRCLSVYGRESLRVSN